MRWFKSLMSFVTILSRKQAIVNEFCEQILDEVSDAATGMRMKLLMKGLGWDCGAVIGYKSDLGIKSANMLVAGMDEDALRKLLEARWSMVSGDDEIRFEKPVLNS